MNYKELAGLQKKSFELNYNNGTIWCEHLDSMGGYEQEVLAKFTEDYKQFCRPSVSSYMIINLDETKITDTIIDYITDKLIQCPKQFRKLAIVGVDRKKQKQFERLSKQTGILIKFLGDYEKAKEWTMK